MNCLLPNLRLQNFENVELMMVKQSKKDSITQVTHCTFSDLP